VWAQAAGNSTLHLILGGAALQRCGKNTVLNPDLAAEVEVSSNERLFPQSLQPWRSKSQIALQPKAFA
jgi:hypothetical protein